MKRNEALTSFSDDDREASFFVSDAHSVSKFFKSCKNHKNFGLFMCKGLFLRKIEVYAIGTNSMGCGPHHYKNWEL